MHLRIWDFKGGGTNFCWPLVLTQRRRGNYVFQIVPMVKKYFFAKGRYGPMPPEYATAVMFDCYFNDLYAK